MRASNFNQIDWETKMCGDQVRYIQHQKYVFNYLILEDVISIKYMEYPESPQISSSHADDTHPASHFYISPLKPLVGVEDTDTNGNTS